MCIRDSVGADDQVAVDRRRHQHPLAVLGRALEDGGAYQIPLSLIQQLILAFGRPDIKGMRLSLIHI